LTQEKAKTWTHPENIERLNRINELSPKLKQAQQLERKNLLGIMADVRGTIGLGLANIRATYFPAIRSSNKSLMRFGLKTNDAIKS